MRTLIVDASGSLGTVDISVFNTPSLATTAATYPIDGTNDAGAGAFSYTAVGGGGNYCDADTGDIVVDSYGAVGSNITGEVTITAWTGDSAGFCATEVPVPQTATFSVKRTANSHTNIHSGIDTISGTRTGGGTDFPASISFTESSASPISPVVDASFGGSPPANVTVLADVAGDELSHLREFDIQFWNGSDEFNPGSEFSLVDGNNYLTERYDSLTCTNLTSGGTLTITANNLTTGLVEGTFAAVGDGTGGCPTAWDGTFSIRTF